METLEELKAIIEEMNEAKAIPAGIICLSSALSYYEPTTYNPSRVDVAIPNNARANKIIIPPINIYFFRFQIFLLTMYPFSGYIGFMFTVKINKKSIKNIEKMPVSIQRKVDFLILDLEEKGPVLPGWPNYSKLSKNEFHCHLSYHWVACWRHEKNSIIIEVYYAGSRENAPY